MSKVSQSIVLGLAIVLAACTEPVNTSETAQAIEQTQTVSGAGVVGLGVYFWNGQWSPAIDQPFPGESVLHIVDGPRRYMQEITLSSKQSTTYSSNALTMLTPVIQGGDFAGLDWNGVAPVAAADGGDIWDGEADGSGTFMHTIYFRSAAWMTSQSTFTFTPTDSNGVPVGLPLVGHTGVENRFSQIADWSHRALVARVVGHACPAGHPEQCAAYYAEALVGLRNALHPDRAFAIPPCATKMRLDWTADQNHPRTVPLSHDTPASYGYGIGIKLALTNAPASGVYRPGDAVTVKITYTDGNGRRLFPNGQVESPGDAILGTPASAGMRVLNFRGDPKRWWAHDGSQTDAQMAFYGDVGSSVTIGTTPISPFALFSPAQIAEAMLSPDGFYAFTQLMPTTDLIFPCYSAPTSPACLTPTADTYTFNIPTDAKPGTYRVVHKAHRYYGGEPQQAVTIVELQVGTTTKTRYPVQVHGCLENCHVPDTHLSIEEIGHGYTSAQLLTMPCSGCHTDGYYFLHDGGKDYRAHGAHAYSKFFASMARDLGLTNKQNPIQDCTMCHNKQPTAPLRF